jgi:hypothetical protein
MEEGEVVLLRLEGVKATPMRRTLEG